MLDKKNFSLEQLSQVAFNIITSSGEAKSYALLAIQDAKNEKFDEATEKLKQANYHINAALESHFELIQTEAQGNQINISLILLHAEDRLLSTQTLLLMAEEIVDLHKKVSI